MGDCYFGSHHVRCLGLDESAMLPIFLFDSDRSGSHTSGPYCVLKQMFRMSELKLYPESAVKF